MRSAIVLLMTVAVCLGQGTRRGVMQANATAKRGSSSAGPVVITFDSYSNGSQLSSQAGWTVRSGAIWITNQTGSQGLITGDANSTVSIADYAGTWSGNQAAECVFGATSVGTAHGVAVRVQGNNAYYLYGDGATIYFAVRLSGADFYSGYSTYAIVAGGKLRLEVTGSGAATRLTGKVDVDGSGSWTTLFSNMDPATVGGGSNYLDGGSLGVSCWNNSHATFITQVTFENL